jgi:hypothetical protein
MLSDCYADELPNLKYHILLLIEANAIVKFGINDEYISALRDLKEHLSYYLNKKEINLLGSFFEYFNLFRNISKKQFDCLILSFTHELDYIP